MLPFGLNSTSEIFQKRIIEQFQDLEGTAIIVDDLVVFGQTKEERLQALLEICHTTGVKLNPAKLIDGFEPSDHMH